MKHANDDNRQTSNHYIKAQSDQLYSRASEKTKKKKSWKGLLQVFKTKNNQAHLEISVEKRAIYTLFNREWRSDSRHLLLRILTLPPSSRVQEPPAAAIFRKISANYSLYKAESFTQSQGIQLRASAWMCAALKFIKPLAISHSILPVTQKWIVLFFRPFVYVCLPGFFGEQRTSEELGIIEMLYRIWNDMK